MNMMLSLKYWVLGKLNMQNQKDKHDEQINSVKLLNQDIDKLKH